ncbi:indolepyruvate oxidoreductase subunit beta [Geobacter hydrogenophilus]|uniref:Indolepyruvate oxidoreductase n=1 Tax=Geobacter hydrogenophilus TaxID=40983 RepID=A0A9W6FZJ2_9BACT|nr:indolepyruvate oxidoreductase subunit beta [Geobacter hydrogenophilus]MBT0893514.1 indolepyruvate oxidoreductase subunit beta [Geobacter hydrogenophilus]GLI37791.1 indolepyruvate oxidoreductase [Geobacter hydrogenophilus]
MNVFNIVIAGVGGQGVLMASKVLAESALASGMDVKQNEVHGMAQRGGSVISFVRIGDKVYSPVVMPGSADILISFEPLEALRYVHYLKPGGMLVYNKGTINPSTVASGLATYPADVEEQISRACGGAHGIDALAIAQQAGNAKAVNMVMVGSVLKKLPIDAQVVEGVVSALSKDKGVEVNLKALRGGGAAA